MSENYLSFQRREKCFLLTSPFIEPGRAQALRQVGLPTLDANGLVIIARWVFAILVVVGGAGAFRKWREKRGADHHLAEPVPIAPPANEPAATMTSDGIAV